MGGANGVDGGSDGSVALYKHVWGRAKKERWQHTHTMRRCLLYPLNRAFTSYRRANLVGTGASALDKHQHGETCLANASGPRQVLRGEVREDDKQQLLRQMLDARGGRRAGGGVGGILRGIMMALLRSHTPRHGVALFPSCMRYSSFHAVLCLSY